MAHLRSRLIKATTRPAELSPSRCPDEAGSTYTFQVQDAPSSPGDDADIDIYKPFAATDGGKGDLDGTANGEIVSTWRVPSNGDATGATLNASATSSDGSIIATTTFTDAKPGSGTTVPNVSVNLDQWADGSVLQGDVDGIGKTDEIWVNGNLNATKAHYNEGDAIPYRAKIDNLTHGVTYGVTIQWDTKQQNQYAIGLPEDIAPIAAFLLGPGARWINGQVITADGGFGGGLS